MADSVESIIRRAIDPASARVVGTLTEPRTYGVYQLPFGPAVSSRFHFGNHPVRMTELEREYGSCSLTYLFQTREDAEAVARTLNGREV